MRSIFYGGQFIEEYRGKLVVIVRPKDEKTPYFETFTHKLTEDAFFNLTGTQAVFFPPVRVYIGVNQRASDEIRRHVHDRKAILKDLARLDQRIVSPIFLK